MAELRETAVKERIATYPAIPATKSQALLAISRSDCLALLSRTTPRTPTNERAADNTAGDCVLLA